jgi:hypothetical protein
VYTLSKVSSDIGGFYTVLFFLGLIICKSSNNSIMYLSLVKRLFVVKDTQASKYGRTHSSIRGKSLKED